MGLDRSILVEESKSMLSESLALLGYLLEPDPPSAENEFWYEKRPSEQNGLFYVIEFQPSGFGKNDLFDLYVNLVRRSYRDFHDPNPSHIDKRGIHVRLAPYLWEENAPLSFQWHFTTVEQLRGCYKDILAKLLAHGIPFLEDLTNTRFAQGK